MRDRPTRLKPDADRHLRPLSGDDRGDPLARQVAPGVPDPPRAVTEDPELLAAWNELVPELDATGTLAACDGLTVELALRHLVAVRRLASSLSTDDVVVADSNHGGTRINPAARELRAQSLAFLEYAKTLGLSVGARSRIRVASADGDDVNPFSVERLS